MDNSTLRIIYAGTPDFSVPALRALADSGHDVIAVYTQPDRRAGRGRKVVCSPVKTAAVELSLPVMQPANLKDESARQTLIDFEADLMIVAAYGLILPQVILDAPKHGCINIHASLLPRWRGAAPIQRAIAAGDAHSGVTIMQMNAGLDTGDMLHVKKCPIDENTTGQQLHDVLATLGTEALLETLSMISADRLKPVVQDDLQATYAHKLEKSEAVIDWHQSAVCIHRQVCAFNAWPVAQTLLAGDTLRVWESRLTDLSAGDAVVGSIVGLKDGLDIATGDGVLRLVRVQAPGRKPVGIADFLNSRDLTVGMQIG